MTGRDQPSPADLEAAEAVRAQARRRGYEVEVRTTMGIVAVRMLARFPTPIVPGTAWPSTWSVNVAVRAPMSPEVIDALLDSMERELVMKMGRLLLDRAEDIGLGATVVAAKYEAKLLREVASGVLALSRERGYVEQMAEMREQAVARQE